MIVVTGAAGFIGSCLVGRLNEEGYKDLILVDDFSVELKKNNWSNKTYSSLVDRNDFFDWLNKNSKSVQFIFHIGARTDTAEKDQVLLDRLNLNFTKHIWNVCCESGIPVVYASSAATYGDGELGFTDDESQMDQLKPLNLYGKSKSDFDNWALAQDKKPFFWAGLKFFNVFGPNEYHKGRMASVIYHAFNQIKATDGMKLFRSHNPDYNNGEQQRDFIYVKDVLDVLMFLMNSRKNSGIYNLGTGTARTFMDLTKAVFKSLGKDEEISFIDTPEDIRDKYQYYTCANMSKLKEAGFENEFTSLEDGVEDYVSNYLKDNKYI
jgi:ADP-L-glycero-D-manno-heptose 6-epimerase